MSPSLDQDKPKGWVVDGIVDSENDGLLSERDSESEDLGRRGAEADGALTKWTVTAELMDGLTRILSSISF